MTTPTMHQETVKTVATGIMILVVTFGIVTMTYKGILLLFAPATVTPARVAGKTAFGTKHSSRNDYSAIHDLFRQANVRKPSPKAVPTASHAAGFKLVGVLAGDRNRARAVLQDHSGTQHLVKKGDSISGITVLSISSNAILLDSRGTVVSLLLEEKGESRTTPAAAVQAPGHHVLDRATFNRQMTDIQTVLSQIRLQPHFTPDGRAAGVQLTHVDRASIMEEIGLKQNDIIRSINSTPIRKPQDIAAFYDTLQQGNPLTISVLRNGRIIPLTLQIR